jgi:glycerate dehydrogenase
VRGVFLDKYPLDLGDVDFSSIETLVPELTFYDRTAPEAVAERIRGVELVILNKVNLTGELMRGADALKLVVLSATGTDNVDLETARELGITVCNCRGYATTAVAQHTFALILALFTRLMDYDRAVRAHNWQHARQFCLLDYPIRELAGCRLGIVGYGELGHTVAHIAGAFNMEVVVAERPGSTSTREGRVAFDEVLTSADVITLHCPLTPDTREIIDMAALESMRSDAFLVNTARGALVAEQDLADALRGGVLAGAAVDVLSQEPPNGDNPLLADDIPNLIVTPHSAWGSLESRQRSANQMAESIQGFQNGQVVRAVTG